MMAEPMPHAGIRRVIASWQPWNPEHGSTAHHEAGHVVVARALGMPVCDARMNQAGTAGVAGVLGPTSTDTPIGVPALAPADTADVYQLAGRVLWKDADEAEAAIRFAVMLAAGRQAELLHAGVKLTAELRLHDPDHQQARELLQRTGQRLAMRYCQLRARHHLTSNWREVEEIAAALNETQHWTPSWTSGLPAA